MITVGPFEISEQDDGSFWINKEGGEGMQVKQDSMLALIEQFWIDYY